MKTTDGHEAKNGSYYYTVDGQQVLLEDCVRLASGEYKYLVVYIYEGTGIDVKCYGGAPVEIGYPFEIEGNSTILNKMFEIAPSPKMSSEYTSGKCEAERLKEELEELKTENSTLVTEVERLQQQKFKLVEDISSMTSVKSILEDDSNAEKGNG